MSHLPYQRVQVDLAALIAKSPLGGRLPAEPELAKQLGVSRATLREAMRMLESQGMIRRRQGAGTFIVGQKPASESGLEVLESPDRFVQRSGVKIGIGNVVVSRIPADELHAVILGVPIKRSLLQIGRIVRSDAQPVAYLVDTIAEDVLRADELTANFDGSVFDFLVQRGDPLTESRNEISAVAASEEIAKILEIQPGVPLLQCSEKLYGGATKVIDYSLGYFVPDYFKFHVMRRVRKA